MLSIAKVTHYISHCAVGRDTKNWWGDCIWCEARQSSSSEGICSVLTQSGLETGPWKEKQVCSSPNAGKGKHNQHQSWQWTMSLKVAYADIHWPAHIWQMHFNQVWKTQNEWTILFPARIVCILQWKAKISPVVDQIFTLLFYI